MKRVLIVTHYFKRQEDVGAIRLRGLAKHLPEWGWEPTVLTSASPSGGDQPCRVVETPFEDLTQKWKRRVGLNAGSTVKDQFGLRTLKNGSTAADRLMKVWEELFSYPDNFISWYDGAVARGAELCREERFDAILSSSRPVTAHLIAHEIKKRTGLPWIADLRDLWTQNNYASHWWLRRVREKRLELRILSTADALTTVSEPLARDLEELHRHRPVVSIPNGFDPDLVNPGLPLNDRFHVVYAGVLYRGRRDPEPLFRAVRELMDEGKMDGGEVLIDLFGDQDGWLSEDVARHGLEGIVRLRGMVPRDEVIDNERRAQVLLLLMWNTPQEAGTYSGKVFEYLAARRPILSWGGGGGVVTGLLERTGAGIDASTYDALKEELFRLYSEHRSHGSVAYRGRWPEIERFSHREMAGRFSAVLDDQCSSSPRSRPAVHHEADLVHRLP